MFCPGSYHHAFEKNKVRLLIQANATLIFQNLSANATTNVLLRVCLKIILAAINLQEVM